jgi:hypothetical protein
MSPPTCIIIPLHAKVVTKVVDPTLTPLYHSRSSGNNHHILPFIDVSVLNMLVAKRQKREWKSILVVMELLCMVSH